MEFILDQQAKFAAGMEDLRGQVAELTSGLDQTHRDQAAIQAIVGRLAEQQLQLSNIVLAISQEQKRLVEAQRHTDERLNTLIDIVDGMVRRPPPP